MHDYRRLKVWERAHLLSLAVYQTTRSFPDGERYGLTAQIRRASVSIEANLAEGSGSGSDRNFARYVQHSIASSTELECELRLALDLGYLAQETHASLDRELGEIRGMLMALAQRLRAKRARF
jgi:four helix bundle protein